MQRTSSQLETLPCRAATQVFENPTLHVFGGTRANQVTTGETVTLGNGDGVIVLGGELTWWSAGACRWRARLPGDGTLAAGHARVWVRSGGRPTEPRTPDVWSAIDANGRSDHSISVLGGVTAIASADDATVFVSATDYDQPARIWRFDKTGVRTSFATLKLPAAQWTYSMTARAGGSVALLASSSNQSLDRDRNDPRLIDFGPLGGEPLSEIRLGKGQFVSNDLVNTPTGWLITLVQSYEPPLLVEVRGDGQILEAHTGPAKARGWTAGTVTDLNTTIGNHPIAIERWTEPMVRGETGSRTASAAYVLPPP